MVLNKAVVLPPIARGAAGSSAGPSSAGGAQSCFVNSSVNTDSARPNKAPTHAPSKTRVDFDGRVSPRHSDGKANPSTAPSSGGPYSV